MPTIIQKWKNTEPRRRSAAHFALTDDVLHSPEEREKKVKKGSAAVGLVASSVAPLPTYCPFGPIWAEGVRARPFGRGGGRGGAADGKCAHKIRQMKTNCAASFVRSRSFVRSLTRETTSLRCHESEDRRCSAKRPKGRALPSRSTLAEKFFSHAVMVDGRNFG